MTPKEFQAALRQSAAFFRRVLLGFVLSGMRPLELRTLQWTHLRPDIGCIVQKEHKTEHVTKEPRRIPLCNGLMKLLLWIKRNRKKQSDFVFLNNRGRPWTRRALDQYFERVREKTGIAKDCKLYSCRHRYGTQAILNGIDLMTLATLMGHRDIRTTQRYLHLSDKLDHLMSAAEKAVRRAP